MNVMQPLVVFAGLAASLAAQIPGHATRLNPTSGHYLPDMARVGDTIHACGWSESPWLFLGWIHYARSDDGGRTWPIREVPLALAGGFIDIAVEGDLVVVLAWSRYSGPYTITSTNGGDTWGLPVRVSQQSGNNELSGAHLHLDGATVSVCWLENRPNGWLWFNQSTNGGFTWRPIDQQIDLGVQPGPLPRYASRLHFAGDGNVFNVVWDPQGIPVGGIYHQRSVDGGATWLPAAQSLTAGQLGNFAADGATLFFIEFVGVARNVWRSIDGGATWGTATNNRLSRPSAVAVDRSVVVLSGERGGQPFSAEASVSFDSGQTWRTNLSVTTAARRFSVFPHVADGDLYLWAYYDDFQQPTGFVLHANPAGTQWRQLASDAGAGLFAWPEGCIATVRPPGTTATEFYSYVLVGHTGVGTGTPGSGGFTPELTANGVPFLGSGFTLEVDRAFGGALGLLGVSFAPPTSIWLGGATLHLASPIVPVVFVASGPAGLPGAGAYALPITIPADPSFAGLPFTSQAFVIDPIAANGFTATRAVETWIQ